MSVSKWAYSSDKCDGDYCPGDCDYCEKAEDDGLPCNVCEHQYKSENEIPCCDCMYSHRSYFERSEPPAKWIKEAYSMVYKCSKCKKTCPGGIKYNFCPNCGAKMEEVEK